MKVLAIGACTSFCLVAAGARAECPVGGPFPDQVVPNTVGVQFEPFHNDALDFEVLRNAGVGLVRVIFRWSTVELSGQKIGEEWYPVYDWWRPEGAGAVDTFLAEAARKNIRLKIYFDKTDSVPAYYAEEDKEREFFRFCLDVVQHCTEKMHEFSANPVEYPGAGLPITWEVGNEQNLIPVDPNMDKESREALIRDAAAKYMELANSVYPVIRAKDRELCDDYAANGHPREYATFVGPALSIGNEPPSDDPYPIAATPDCALIFLDECLAKGLGGLVDGISIHPYRAENPESVVVSLRPGYYPTVTYSDIRSVTGRIPPPIVAGEWGYATASNFSYTDTTISQQMQADYLARMNLVNLGECIPYTMWFFLTNGGNWGILNDDRSPKPSYLALKTLTSTLNGARFDFKIGDTDPSGPNWMVFRAKGWWGGEKWILAAWNAANVNSINTDPYWGTYALTGTPLYVGQRLTWQLGASGAWSQSNAWTGGPWPNNATSEIRDNYQAQFDTTASIDVNGTYRISGLHFNASDVFLNGNGALDFTDGGGNLYAGANGRIECRITGGGDPSTFVLRKSGTGMLGLGPANTFRGGVLIEQGALAMGNDRALGDISNPLTLDGGELCTQGYDFATTSPIEITRSGSVISNYTTDTHSVCSFPYTNVRSDFAVVRNANTSIELAGQLFCHGDCTLTTWGDGNLKLSGPGDNVGLGLNAYQGTVSLDKASNTTGETHAVAFIDGIYPGARVKYTGNRSDQVYQGGYINLNGGTLDFNGRIQIGTTMSVLQSSTIANTAAGTYSKYVNSGIQLQGNSTLNIDAVGDFLLDGPIGGTGNVSKSGKGLLTLAGPNTTGGSLIIDGGRVECGAPDSCPGPGKIVVNSDGALVAIGGLGAQGSLNRIHTSSTGTLALRGTTVGLSTGGYDSLYIGADAGYTPILMGISPSGHYRFGGGGGVLIVWTPLSGSERKLFVKGDGTVNLVRPNTYGGGTTVDSGILQFSSGSLPANGSVLIQFNGTLAATGAFPTVSEWLGSGRIDTASSGTLALTNHADDEVSMGNYGLWLGATGDFTYSGRLAPNNANYYLLGGGGGTLTVRSALDNTGVVAIRDKVKLTSPSNSYQEWVAVYGTLWLNGSAKLETTKVQLWNNGSLYQNSTAWFNSPIEFQTAGTVGGTGVFGGDLGVGNGGHLSPGSSGIGSVGTMSVAGDVVFGADAVLDFDILNGSAHDVLSLGIGGGNLTLGGTLSIHNLSSTELVPPGDYHLITGISTYTGLENLHFSERPDARRWSIAVVPAGGRYDLVVTVAP